jgi:hypothetical protein
MTTLKIQDKNCQVGFSTQSFRFSEERPAKIKPSLGGLPLSRVCSQQLLAAVSTLDCLTDETNRNKASELLNFGAGLSYAKACGQRSGKHGDITEDAIVWR